MADAGAATFTEHRAVLTRVTGRASPLWVCDAYEMALRGRGLAERSFTVYGQTARALAAEHDLATVTAGDIERWLASLAVTGRTRGAYLVRLRGLFKWLVREGYRPDNPCDLIDVPKVPARQPRPIPDRYLRAAWNLAQPRERAWLALGAFCGLRAGEAARVAVDDVQDEWLRVRGKGGRERSVPMRDEVWQALEDWGWPAEGRFFPGCSDKRPSVMCGRVFREVGAPDWVSFHSCRHRYATALYRQCGDLRIVQDMLGHSSLQTTAMYLQVMPEAAASAVRAMPGLVA